MFGLEAEYNLIAKIARTLILAYSISGPAWRWWEREEPFEYGGEGWKEWRGRGRLQGLRQGAHRKALDLHSKLAIDIRSPYGESREPRIKAYNFHVRRNVSLCAGRPWS